ncbi:MAG: hypothetical protein Kow0077_30420 [Anaerolineae bacterium]
MLPQTVFLIRHGEVDGNILMLDRQVTTADFNAIVNRVPHEELNARGFEQARAVAARLHGRELTCLYTSPLLRTRQTAGVIADQLDIPVIVRDDLYELMPAPLNDPLDRVRTLRRAYMRSGLRLGNPFTRDTETVHHALKRIIRAFNQLTAETRTNFGVVGHQGIFRLLFLWLHLSPTWELAYGDTINCGVSVITRRRGHPLP